jgi:hypothetical protein
MAKDFGVRKETIGAALRVLTALQLISRARANKGFRPNDPELWLAADEVSAMRAQVMRQIVADRLLRKEQAAAKKAEEETRRAAMRKQFHVV